MKAIRIHDNGGPEVMRLEEVPVPEPGPGQVRIRLEAIGVNFIDCYQRSGLYPIARPFTPGLEGAGEIEAVGEGVDVLAPGARVAWSDVSGSYAEQMLAPAARLVEVPAAMDPRLAAAAMLQGMTAHYLARTTWRLRSGQVCLIHAAAGGVGLLLVQLAHRVGAKVFATVSTEAKAELARAAGADRVVLYTSEDFEAVVRDETGGAGVHVVYDSVGQTTWEKSLRCLKKRGMLVLFGQSSGRVPPIDPLALSAGSLFLTRPRLFDYIPDRSSLLERAAEVLGLVEREELDLRIGATYPLAEAADAHRALEGRETTGKVLLTP